MEAKANQAKAVLNISNLVKIYELECEKRLLDQRLALVQAQALADEAELEVGLWQGELDRKALNTSDKQVHIPHSDYGEQYTLRNNVTSHQEVDWLTHGSADPGDLLEHVSAGVHDIPRNSVHMLAGTADLTLLRHVSADPDSLLKYASASADDVDRHKGQDPCRYVATGTGDNHGQSDHKGHIVDLPGYKGRAGEMPGSADPGGSHVSASIHDIPRDSIHMLAGKADLTLLRHVSADPDGLLKYASASADDLDRHKGQDPCRYVAAGTGDNHGQSGHKGHVGNLPGYKGHADDLPGYKGHAGDLPGYKGHAGEMPGYKGHAGDLPGYKGHAGDLPGYKGHAGDLPGYKGHAGDLPGSADPGGSLERVSASVHDDPRDSVHMPAGKADLTLLRHVSADPDRLLKYASASADDLDRHKGQDPCRYVATGTGDNHGQRGYILPDVNDVPGHKCAGHLPGYKGRAGDLPGYKGHAGDLPGYKGHAGDLPGYKGRAGEMPGYKGHAGDLPGYKGHAGDLPGYKGHAGDLPGYKGHAGDLPGSADPGGSLERVSASVHDDPRDSVHMPAGKADLTLLRHVSADPDRLLKYASASADDLDRHKGQDPCRYVATGTGDNHGQRGYILPDVNDVPGHKCAGHLPGYKGRAGDLPGYKGHAGDLRGYKGHAGDLPGYKAHVGGLPHRGDHSGYRDQVLPHRGDQSGYRGQVLPHRGDHSGYRDQVLPHRGDHSGYRGQVLPHRGDHSGYQDQVLPHRGDHSGYQDQVLPHGGDHSGYRGQVLSQEGDHSGFQGPVLPHRGDHSGYRGQVLPHRGDHSGYQDQVLPHRGDHSGYRGQVLSQGGDHSGFQGPVLPHRGDHSGYRGQVLPQGGDHSGFQGTVLPHRGDHSGYQGQRSPQRDDRFDCHEQLLLQDHFGQESQSERSDCHIPTTCHVKVNRSTLNPEAPVWQNNANHRSQFRAHDIDSSTNLGDILRAQQQVCQQMVSTLHVPNPEIMTFSGDPMQYWKFITNFETAIESQVSDNRKRLGYLIQHCTGESKAYIEDCDYARK